MIKAKKSDKKLVCTLLSSAFSENPSVNYIVRGERRRNERIHALMRYSFEQCVRFGEVWLSDDGKACALLLFPHRKRMNLSSIWLDLKLIFQAIGPANLTNALHREHMIGKKRPKEPMVYLWFIAVDPGSQHKGIGTILLSQVVQRAAELNLPIYLETSVSLNLPWYDRFGLRKYDEQDLGYRLFFLAKTS